MVRSRSTFSNVVACLALFVALGGGAYAVATRFVGHDGTIHGCVTATGKLTLVKPGRRCTKGSPIAWNQNGSKGARGPRGLQGPKGARGPIGVRGPTGPGATSINITRGFGTGTTLGTFNGVTVVDSCKPGFVSVGVGVPAGSGNPQAGTVFISGDKAEDGTLSSIQTTATGTYSASGAGTANLDVIAMNQAVGKWARFDLGGFHGSTGCNIWGFVIPGS